jgi:hypothetical protein
MSAMSVLKLRETAKYSEKHSDFDPFFMTLSGITGSTCTRTLVLYKYT